MTREEFEKLVDEEFPKAVPEKFHHLLKNIVFLVEDEPDAQTRKEEGLSSNETLLGLYKGVPATARGEGYGIGGALPDTITLYQTPIEDEAAAMGGDVRKAIRETIWHEVAHAFGYDEHQVRDREAKQKMEYIYHMQPKVYLAPFYIIAATFIGIADTLYLSYYHWLGITPTCAIGGCEIVLQSKYSMIGGALGIPFAYVGLFFYIYFLALAVLLAIDPTSRGLRFGLMTYATIGFLSSIGFELFQYFVIHALCMYCAISALTTLILFCLSVWHLRSTRRV